MEKNSLNYKCPIEFTREKLGSFVASNILKNKTLGGTTHFYRRWATCLGSRDNLPNWQIEAGQAAGEKAGPPSVKVAHVYVILRYALDIQVTFSCMWYFP